MGSGAWDLAKEGWWESQRALKLQGSTKTMTSDFPSQHGWPHPSLQGLQEGNHKLVSGAEGIQRGRNGRGFLGPQHRAAPPLPTAGQEATPTVWEVQGAGGPPGTTRPPGAATAGNLRFPRGRLVALTRLVAQPLEDRGCLYSPPGCRCAGGSAGSRCAPGTPASAPRRPRSWGIGREPLVNRETQVPGQPHPMRGEPRPGRQRPGCGQGKGHSAPCAPKLELALPSPPTRVRAIN